MHFALGILHFAFLEGPMAKKIKLKTHRGAAKRFRRAKRKKLLGLAKGYYANKSKLYRAAKESVDTALKYAFVGRRRKKRDFRRLWVIRINAAAREHGLTYGQLINGLKNAGVTLDRKSLSELAISSPAAFATLAKQAKAAAKPVARA